jgi:antitoxin VapB
MATTRVFRSGNSRAVRIPRGIALPLGSVEIFERGDEVVIRRRRGTLADVPALLASLRPGFMSGGRRDRRPQRRKGL